MNIVGPAEQKPSPFPLLTTGFLSNRTLARNWSSSLFVPAKSPPFLFPAKSLFQNTFLLPKSRNQKDKHTRKRRRREALHPSHITMLKRKINSLPSTELSTDGRDFSIRNCVKDLRLRRVFSPGSDPQEIGSCGKAGLKDPIEDSGIEEKGNKADLAESLDKGPVCKEATNKIGNTPKGILKRPNGSGNEIENSVRLTPPETIINTSQNGFINKTKPRIAPSRLVRVPGSFSYRRLLPFLMEIDKKDDQKLENVNSNSVEAIEKPKFDENPNSEISNSEIQEPNSTSISDSINSQSSEIEIPNFAATPNSEIPKSETTNPNSSNSINSHHPIDDLICFPSLSPTRRTLTVEELSGGNLYKKGEIRISPKRGIIKRDNTRGCKGICTCLDCASFRIHAEKAFDFSKKQMHESDEIIGGLVKELSSLRQLLENSSGNNNNQRAQSYQDEIIKVACQRASIAEKIANNRTEQMFMDLNAHCKIPGPKVAFSDCIEQKIIPSCRHDQA